jgi:hypothetical protein
MARPGAPWLADHDDRSEMSSDQPARVDFPASPDGRRSTSALGRSVVADALREADKSGALAAEREKNWRKGYLAHFRRLIEAGLPSREAAVVVAQDGLESLHRRMRVIGGDGTETGLDAVRSAPARSFPATLTVPGTGQPDRQLLVPYQGERLHGDPLLRRLDAWVAAGIIEPSCAEAVRAVVAHPEWLPLPGQTAVVLGAGAEIGPLSTLLSWGARAIGVDLPSPAIWARVLDMAHRSGGTLEIPVADREAAQRPGASDDDSLAQNAGLDLAGDIPTAADWIASVDGPLVLGNYVYADGAANVRVSSAVDALTVRLQAARPDVTLAFLATPTDVFAVPDDAIERSRRAYAARPAAVKMASLPLRALSGGRLLRRAYLTDAVPGINDSLVAQQGPNYALAKRLQRWRATVARQDGATVSLNVAPPTRTRSVLKNRALAAAYAGAHHFGVQAFEPATTRVLMAALLVHDLYSGSPAHEHPWQDEAYAAAPGGLWRIPYAPRSALMIAALMGYSASRSS